MKPLSSLNTQHQNIWHPCEVSFAVWFWHIGTTKTSTTSSRHVFTDVLGLFSTSDIIYKDVPLTKLHEKMYDLFALLWWPNSYCKTVAFTSRAALIVYPQKAKKKKNISWPSAIFDSGFWTQSKTNLNWNRNKEKEIVVDRQHSAGVSLKHRETCLWLVVTHGKT